MYQYEGNVPSFIIPSIINKSFTGTFNSDGCQLTLYNIYDKNTNITIPAIIRNININRDAENIISCILARSIFTKLRQKKLIFKFKKINKKLNNVKRKVDYMANNRD
jgi:hypothetical protein